MALPTRDELLRNVDARFRERVPTAPAKLDPNDTSQAELIDIWWETYHEVLSKMTDESFFAFFPDAPEHLDPADPKQADLVAYWKDIAAQISGEPGRHNWSNAAVPGAESEEIEMPVQDGSAQLEDRIGYIRIEMENYARAVVMTVLGAKVVTHTTAQIDKLRDLVRDGTFQRYDHWWRSESFSETVYDESGSNQEVAFVRDLTLEAKIDRSTGVLDAQLSGWATDFVRDTHYGHVSAVNT